jgi:DNA repair exonuclease SbcCD nuclease subunit
MRSLKFLLNPIKDRILCVVEGNHDRRISKATGFDIVEELTDDLNIPYARGQAILDLRIGQRNSNPRSGKYAYSIAISHGYGGGRTYGAKANKITHWADTWEGIDLFILGHVHSPMSIPKARYKFDRRTGSVSVAQVRSVILSAYQEQALYSVQGLYPPSSKLNYLIRLHGNEKKITITEVES